MSLLVALFLLLAQSSIDSAERWTLVATNGVATTVSGSPHLKDAERVRLRSAWVWSNRLAPRRVAVEKVGIAGTTASTGFEDDSARLTVGLATRPSASPSPGLRLVAAPLDMWIEMAERDLPSWPLPPSGQVQIPVDGKRPWRVRLIGRGVGSWWIDVPAKERSLSIRPLAAKGLSMRVFDAEGNPVGVLMAALQESQVRGGIARAWANERSAEGAIEIVGLPDVEELSITIRSPDSAPLVVRGRPSLLPQEVHLPQGVELVGRIVDHQDQPIAGAVVEVESWSAPDLPQLQRMRSRTDPQGNWILRGVPAARVSVTLSAPRFAPITESHSLLPGRTDLGSRSLEAGQSLALRIVDDAGVPVAGAKINASRGQIFATADERGIVRLDGLSQAPFELRVGSPGYLAARATINPPLPTSHDVVLERAMVLTGRLTARGEAISEGGVQVLAEGCDESVRLSGDGRFEIDMPPRVRGELVARSPRTEELRVPLSAGRPGERRDLGDLEASIGVAVVGRVVRKEDGSPLEGARLWTTRQDAEGAVSGWATGDLLETRSDAHGRFLLMGLRAVPATIRAEVAGLARGQVVLSLESFDGNGEETIDLGIIELTTGATVRVAVDSREIDSVGAIARADVGNRWQDPDLLSAQVWNGEAVIPYVPPGEITVSVLAGSRLLCEHRVSVIDGEDRRVECRRSRKRVVGVALLGQTPIRGGLLSFRGAGEVPGPSRIETTVSPSGLRQQQVTGFGRPTIDVVLAQDGRFETEELGPGFWLATWRATGAADAFAVTGTTTFEIPRGETEAPFEAVVRFAGEALSGRVEGTKGEAIEGARVRELKTGALALTDASGSFFLAGLAPGVATVRAQREDSLSEATEVELLAGEAHEPVRLVLTGRSPKSVVVRVRDGNGQPAAGAIVFLDIAARGIQILSTGADGRVRIEPAAPRSERLRFAAFSRGAWGFGEWLTVERAYDDGVSLDLAVGGALSIESEERADSIRITDAGGWDVAWLSRLLGAPLRLEVERPLRVGGLPEGRYTVSVGERTVGLDVRGGEVSEARIDGGD